MTVNVVRPFIFDGHSDWFWHYVAPVDQNFGPAPNNDVVRLTTPAQSSPHFQQNLRALKLSVNWPDAENELELEPELEA
jgi:hypothetical protein